MLSTGGVSPGMAAAFVILLVGDEQHACATDARSHPH
jgi:hypothetical protein